MRVLVLARHDICVGVRGQAQAAVLTSHLVQAIVSCSLLTAMPG